LQFFAIGAIHVITAVITAQGENMIANTAEPEMAPAAPPEPKVTKTGRARKRGANVAPKKAKSGKKATAAKKAPKTRKRQNKGASTRDGSKAATILELLKRPGGATAKELMKATGWQPHSVRGFLSGTIRKKMGLTVTSTKGEDRERNYSIKA